jgi:hypothetical protein
MPGLDPGIDLPQRKMVCRVTGERSDASNGYADNDGIKAFPSKRSKL